MSADGSVERVASADHKPGASALRRLARGGVVNVVGGISSAGFAFGLTVLITRSLGASSAGVLFESAAALSILTLLAQAGSTSTLVRPVAQYAAGGALLALRRVLVVAFAPVAALSILVAAVLAATAPALADVLVKHGDRAAATAYLQWFAIALPFAALAGPTVSAIRGLGSMGRAAIVENGVVPLSRLGVAGLAIALGVRLSALGAVWTLPAAAGFIVAILYLRAGVARVEPRDPEAPSISGLFGAFWSFTAPRTASSLLQGGILWLDVLLLGSLASSRSTGLYAAASRLSILGTMILTAIVLAIGPELSVAFGSGAYDEIETLYKRSTVWVVAASAPIYILLAGFAPVIMRLFGGGFSEGGSTLRILAIANLAEIGAGPVLTILLMGGRTGLLLFNSAAGLTLNVGLNALLIPKFGANGAAFAWGATIVFTNLFGIYQVRACWSVDPFSRELGEIFFLSLMIFGGVSALGLLLPNELLGLVVAVLLGGMLYLAVLARFSQRFGLSIFSDLLSRRSPVLAN